MTWSGSKIKNKLSHGKDLFTSSLAINASSHYRKANRADIAGELLKTIDIKKKKSSKIKSAFYTTYGGVKRDLKRTDEAIQLGKKAHQLMPKDFRPCTLLGAIYMENHEHTVGQEWYTKALERGANQNAINSDLRSIYMRADKSGRAKLRAHLLNVDPECYRWVNSLQNK